MRKRKLFLLDPPQPQSTIERFGYVIGRQGIVNVTVYANPRPRFLWRVNNEMINEGRPDESNRLETSTAVDLVNCSINSLNDFKFNLNNDIIYYNNWLPFEKHYIFYVGRV